MNVARCCTPATTTATACAVRYPRGSGTGATLEPLASLPIGKGGETSGRENSDPQLWHPAAGSRGSSGQTQRHRWICAVKPLDTALILQLAGEHDALVTLEENAIMGGAGSGVNEVLMAHRRAVPVLNIGLPDYFIPQGTQEEIRADLGLDAAGIEAKIRDWLA